VKENMSLLITGVILVTLATVVLLISSIVSAYLKRPKHRAGK
jgi:hypothetical protein